MFIKFIRLAFSVFALLMVYCSNAQTKIAGRQFSAIVRTVYNGEKRITKFSNYTSLSLPSAAMAAYCRSSTAKAGMNLRLTKDIAFDLELEHATIVSPDYKLYLKTPGGVQVVNTHPDFLYKGKTKEGGGVRLAIKDGFISGSILTSDKEYFIEPMKRYDERAGADEFIFYESADVIDSAMSCGTTEQGNSNTANERVAGGVCKTASIFNMADYSVYQHYGNSIEAVENFLLTNLNNVEGVYTNFNFDSADTADTGNDNIKFKVTASYISTCATCDFADSTNSFGAMARQLKEGFFTTLGQDFISSSLIHIWTMRPINTGMYLVSGAAGGGFDLLKHTSDNPLYLRLVAAHETGHSLGCDHDNNMNPAVTQYIMYSAATPNATRFSRLSDFGGINYSSNLAIKKSVLKPVLFLSDCATAACERVKDITVQYMPGKGPRIGWTGNGRVAINYKQKYAAQYEATTQQFIDSNAITINGLLPCEDYTIEIEKECSANVFGPAEQVYINTGSVELRNVMIKNRRNELYDFSCNASGYTSLLKDAVITVDHVPYKFMFDAAALSLSVNNLFADGARHRIDITYSNNSRFCTDPFYFQAPYYRDNSTVALAADFNNCSYPNGWRDTLVQVKQDPANGYKLNFATITSYNTFSNQGTIDSSCMASCNIVGAANGKLVFQSPETDLSALVNTILCFDYNFTGIQPPAGILSKPVFSVDGFDGVSWKKLYSFQKLTYIKPIGRYISIWDSLPARKFIALDSFHNKNFTVRFVMDDGAFLDTSGLLIHSPFMAALDNIRVDGYSKNAVPGAAPISVFPNPVTNEVFIKTRIPSNTVITYRIIDIVGRQLGAGLLTNNRINVEHLAQGIFVVQFFTTDKKIYSVKIVKP